MHRRKVQPMINLILAIALLVVIWCGVPLLFGGCVSKKYIVHIEGDSNTQSIEVLAEGITTETNQQPNISPELNLPLSGLNNYLDQLGLDSAQRLAVASLLHTVVAEAKTRYQSVWQQIRAEIREVK